MSDNPAITLSISVVCYHSAHAELQQLVSSLLDSIEQLQLEFDTGTVEVFLIDNSELDDKNNNELSMEIFADKAESADRLGVQIRLVKGHGNIGYGAAHNLSVNKMAGDYHLILNPDVVLDKNCLLTGIKYLQEETDVVLASPYSSNEQGQKQYLCKQYPALLTFFLRGFFPGSLGNSFAKRQAVYEMHELVESEPTKGIPIVSGCFMLCRAQQFKELGGFDERFFLYFEDFDLSLRIRKKGEISYIPAMKIRHGGGNAASKGSGHVRMFMRSAIRFYSTHGWRLFKQ